MKKIDIVVRIIEIGNSMGLTIDKKSIEYLKIKRGDLVKITIYEKEYDESKEK